MAQQLEMSNKIAWNDNSTTWKKCLIHELHEMMVELTKTMTRLSWWANDYPHN